jgi:flagellar motor switch protein FliN/FliY
MEELLRQIAGQAATALASAAGGEVKFHVAASAAPSWSSSATTCLYTRDEAGTPVTIEIQIGAALAAALQPRAEALLASASSPAPPPPAAASYERLRDVVLDVKLRFGSRRMLLRDVLALSAGVVVELDNNLNSPVDLLLDGRVVAQGEVVVVDGNYGLRVTHVLDSVPPS